jgi:Holliday junction resolvase-like predicted endonuclease
VVARNWQSPFAEVDILAVDGDGLVLLVEAKTVPGDWHEPISPAQLRRLRRAQGWIIDHLGNCCLLVALVDPRGRITIVEPEA